MAKVDFELDISGGAQILRNNPQLIAIQQSAMNGALANIEAQFFQTFGVDGRFELVEFTTDRANVKIRAADDMTGAILKANPKWLSQFVTNINI